MLVMSWETRAVSIGDFENFCDFWISGFHPFSLQHFSALSRDQLAGELVNLCPSETPKDPYTDIVRVLETKRRQDAAKGKREAIILDGFLERDIVKRIVMRVGYGASRDSAIGYAEQWLQDLDHFPRKHVRRCSQYLGTGILECNSRLFKSADQLRRLG